MSDKINPLDTLPKNEWDALIHSILNPFLIYAKNDPLIAYDDLAQEAWVALLHAAQKYNPTLFPNTKFSTFAYYYIRGRMLRYIDAKIKLSQQRCEHLDNATLDQESYVDNTSENKELIESIFGAIANEPHANFLLEHYIKGKSFRKIAKEHGGTMAHQSVALHVKHLTQLLEKRLNHENA